jgi:hypothetical protein
MVSMPSHRNRKSRLPSEAKVFRHRPPAAVPPAPGRPGVSVVMGEGTFEAGPFGLLSEGAVSPFAAGADEGLSFDWGSRRIEALYLVSAPGQHLREFHRRIRSAKSNWRRHLRGPRLTAAGRGVASGATVALRKGTCRRQNALYGMSGSSLVMTSSTAGSPDSTAAMLRWMAGTTCAGSSTLSV